MFLPQVLLHLNFILTLQILNHCEEEESRLISFLNEYTEAHQGESIVKISVYQYNGTWCYNMENLMQVASEK